MSFSTEEDILCECTHEYRAVLWSSINVQDNPEMREIIMAGQLNVVECPMCKRFMYLERFVLYHDPAYELMAFVYPKSDEAEADRWRRKTQEDVRVAQTGESGETEVQTKVDYEPCTLFGIEALVALLHQEEERADQSAIFESLAQDLSLQVQKMRPSLARLYNFPTRLPLFGANKPPQERLQEGLKRLLAANNQLSLYQSLLDRLPHETIDLNPLLS